MARVSAWITSSTPSTNRCTESTLGPLRRVRKSPKRRAKTITGRTSPAAIAETMLSGTIRIKNSGSVEDVVEKPSGRAAGVGKIEVGPGLDDIHEGHADGNREGRRHRVVENGADTHTAHRTGAAEAGNTTHQRGENEWDDDHFQKPEEEVAEKADFLCGRGRQPTEGDTRHQGKEHLPVELDQGADC